MMPDDAVVQVLLVEDNEPDAEMVKIHLGSGLPTSYHVEWTNRLSLALSRLSDSAYDAVLLDLNLPDSAGLETLLDVREVASRVPVVVLSGVSDVELAVEAVAAGAQDYVVKGAFDGESLDRAVRFAIERSQRVQAEAALQSAEQQLQLARDVQQRLYPDVGPVLPGFDIAGAVYSADEACGDYFDFIPMANDTLGVVLGDVSGHGLPAALLMVEVRACLRSFTRSTADIGKILSETNAVIVGDHTNVESRQFISLFAARLDPATRTLVYASAGHVGYLFNRAGQVTEFASTGPLLGLAVDLNSPCADAVNLESGDLILLPTDGIWEARSTGSKMFGKDRMFDVVLANRQHSAEEIVESVYAAAREFAGGNLGVPQQDDMAAIVVKVL